jgi:glycosyltransferase involved in cell wall biosynthesis
LRTHCIAYLHGHQVGGTNPSLLEAMGAGNAVIARDNAFNRWVAGRAARYFQTAQDVDDAISLVLTEPKSTDKQRAASTARIEAEFTWDRILGAYHSLLATWARQPMQAGATQARQTRAGAASVRSDA